VGEAVISVTNNAASAIRRMTNARTYPDAGLRIKSVDESRFAMTIVPQPTTGDVAVRAYGAKVYLDHDAAAALDHAILDAADHASQSDQFTLASTNN
jgi:Fe-S cluster assembly iron-binding protein IscA